MEHPKLQWSIMEYWSRRIGYGDNDDNTIISSNTISVMRKTSNSRNKWFITPDFTCDYDDGFIAYLNGTEIMRSNNFSTFLLSIQLTTTMKQCYIMEVESKLFSFEDLSEILFKE